MQPLPPKQTLLRWEPNRKPWHSRRKRISYTTTVLLEWSTPWFIQTMGSTATSFSQPCCSQ